MKKGKGERTQQPEVRDIKRQDGGIEGDYVNKSNAYI